MTPSAGPGPGWRHYVLKHFTPAAAAASKVTVAARPETQPSAPAREVTDGQTRSGHRRRVSAAACSVGVCVPRQLDFPGSDN